METLGLWNALESFARGCRSETGPIVDRGMQCEQRFGASRGVLLLCWLWGKLLAKLMFKDTSDLSRAIAVIGRLCCLTSQSNTIYYNIFLNVYYISLCLHRVHMTSNT